MPWPVAATACVGIVAGIGFFVVAPSRDLVIVRSETGHNGHLVEEHRDPRPPLEPGDERRLRVHGVGFESDDRLFVPDELGNLDTYDVRTGKRCGHDCISGARPTFCVVSPTTGRALLGTSGDISRPDLTLVDLADHHVIGRTRRAETWKTAALALDGRHVVVATWSGHLEVWDLETGRLVQELSADTEVSALAVSPDGSRVASGHREIAQWDLATGRLVAPPGDRSWHEPDLAIRVIALVFTPAGLVPAYEMERETHIERLRTSPAARLVAFDARGSRAISCGPGGELDFWDLEAQTVRRLPEKLSIESASFSADGSLVVTTPLGTGPLVVRDFASGRVVRVVSLEDGQSAVVPTGSPQVHGAGFTGEGQLLVHDELGDMDIYDPKTGAWRGHYFRNAPGTTFFEVSAIIGVGLAGRPFDEDERDLTVIDLSTRAARAHVGRDRGGWRVAALGSWQTLVVAASDGYFELWHFEHSDTRDGSLVWRSPGDDATSALTVYVDSRSPGPRFPRFVTGNWDGLVQVWDMSDGRRLSAFPTGRGEVLALSFWDGEPTCTVGTSTGGETHVFELDLRTGSVRNELTSDAPAHAIAFDLSGTRALSGSATGTIELWDLRAKTVRRLPETCSIESAGFHWDGKRVVTTPRGSGPLVVRDFATGNVEQVIPVE